MGHAAWWPTDGLSECAVLTHEIACRAVPQMSQVSSHVAAAYLDVGEDVVVRWAEQGKLVGKMACGGKWLIRSESLMRLGPGGRP